MPAAYGRHTIDDYDMLVLKTQYIQYFDSLMTLIGRLMIDIYFRRSAAAFHT